MSSYTRWPLVRIAGLVLALVALSTLAGAGLSAAQGTATPSPTPPPPPTNTARPTFTPSPPAPTLVPPTPLPTLTPTPYNPPTQSALASVQNSGTLRVGTLYNAFPFSWLDESGEVVGYEADVMRAVGIELGVEIEFVQVTRQNADQMLLGEHVDVLIGQQALSRDRERQFDFSHPYYVNREMMVVLTDAPYTTLADLAGRSIAVPIGTRSERALRHWMTQTGVEYNVLTYFTESAALDALAAGEVAGMVGTLDSLRRAGRQGMRLIEEPVLTEYYAVAMRRYDVNLRNLLNRSLQRLKASGRLEEIFRQWFSEDPIDFSALVPVYDMLYTDERTLADFPTDMPYPTQSVLARIDSGQTLRVAGIVPADQDAPNARIGLLDPFNQALIAEMARRWGVQIEVVPISPLMAVDAVANGLADVAVGVDARWDGADRVEYSQPYALTTDRLAVPRGSQITTGFGDMLGTGWWIGYFADDSLDADKIKALAEYFGVARNINDPYPIQREENAFYALAVEHTIDAIFGDHLRLVALQRQGYENSVTILETPYGDALPITFAAPRNDADFRALVNYTLQDMARDGTYQQLWAQHFAVGDPIPVRYTPPIGPDAPAPR